MPKTPEAIKLKIDFRSYQIPVWNAMQEKKRAIIDFQRRAGKDQT